MTDLPAWARACLEVDGVGSDNKSLSAHRGHDNAKLSAHGPWKKLGPLTQEKGDPFWGSVVNHSWTIRDSTPIAGFTCVECPQRERYYSYTERVYSKHGDKDKTVHKYTQRCTECSRKMKRWQRGQQDAEQAQIASICYEQGISFVTLTLPNMVGRATDSVRTFKRHVADFRKRFPEDVISGGKDYYEWTTHPDDRAWSEPIVHNVHMHGVWIMDYWSQAEFQNSWSLGIVHVKRLKKSRDAVRYATKYAGKQDVSGIRLKEGFGCLYGSAKRAMLEAYQHRLADESSTAEGAQD